MSQFTSFDGLPLIVHDRILRSLPSPQDVASTIRASPGSLHAFVTGRRSILLSALKNFLSPENQHLMNLVVAAPQYYHHIQVDSSSFDGSIFKAHDLNQALNFAFIHKRDLRPLTSDNFDDYIRLYALFGKAIMGYHLFTFARDFGRVPKLSTPEATRSRYKFTDWEYQTPKEEETPRLWRGFLLYELFCVMYGVNQMMSPASSQNYHVPLKVLNISKSFKTMPIDLREEVMCVQQYVQEQYDLAFNALVERFELAISGLDRQASDTSLLCTSGTMPIIELGYGDRAPVQHLLEPPFGDSNTWTTNMATLGIGFLQRFLSSDSSTRLDFVRTTYCCLGNQAERSFDLSLTHELHVRHLTDKVEDRRCKDYITKHFPDDQLYEPAQLSLRAIGWIFWGSYDFRTFDLSTEEIPLPGESDFKNRIRPHLRLQGRPHLMETSVKPQEWQRIVQYFAPSYSESQRNAISGLFRSIGNFKPDSLAEIISTLRSQDVQDAPTEAGASSQ